VTGAPERILLAMTHMKEGPAFGAGLLKNIEARELGQARSLLLVIGVLNIILQGLMYSELAKNEQAIRALASPQAGALFDKLRTFAIAGIVAGGIFIACGIAVYRKPLPATVTGLGLYVAMIVVQAMIDPTTLLSGLFGTGIRIAILIGLVSAVQFARIFERNRREREAPRAVVVSG
jgi:hypothetical protein